MFMKNHNCFLVIFAAAIFFVGNVRAQWVQVADFAGGERDDLVAFTCQERAFAGSGMAIGYQVTNDFYAYDDSTNTWSGIADLPGAARQYAFSFSFTTNACVFAGITQMGSDLKDGYLYNPQTNQWTSIAPYPGSGSRACAAATLHTNGFAGLGRNNSNQLFNDWWQYDVINNTWTQKASFPGLARNLAACFESNGFIYVIGGIGENDVALGDLWQYNPQTNSWLSISSLLSTPIGSMAHCKVKYSGAMVGGFDGLSNYTDNALCFDAFNNSLNSLPPIPNQGSRKGAKAFSLHGALYITCGITADNTRLKSTWKYDLVNAVTANHSFSEWFHLHPNPAESDLFLTIQSTRHTETGTYYILQQDGTEISSGVIAAHDSTIKINTESLAAGCYLLKIIFAGHVAVKKVVIYR